MIFEFPATKYFTFFFETMYKHRYKVHFYKIKITIKLIDNVFTIPSAADEVLSHRLDAQEMPNLSSLYLDLYLMNNNLIYYMTKTLISVLRNWLHY